MRKSQYLPFQCWMLNKGTTGTIFIASLVWRGPWLGIEPGTSLTRCQHSTTRLLMRQYFDVVWHNCSNQLKNDIEAVQIEAARIATKLCNIISLLVDLGWETLEARRKTHRLCLLYKMKQNLCPSYLSNLLPSQTQDRYQLQNSEYIPLIHARTQLYNSSFLPSLYEIGMLNLYLHVIAKPYPLSNAVLAQIVSPQPFILPVAGRDKSFRHVFAWLQCN